MNTVYALLYYAYIEGTSEAEVMLFTSYEAALDEMKRQYEETIELWRIDKDNLFREGDIAYQSLNIAEESAWVSDYPNDAFWRIEEKVIGERS